MARDLGRTAAVVLAAAVAVCVLALPADAGAQVNTEKIRADGSETGFHGFFKGSGLLKTGNVELLRIGLGARLEYSHGRHQTYLQGDYTFAQKGGLDLGDDSLRYLHSGFGHLRWTAMWHPRVGTELFTQTQFNEFLRLKLRLLGGAGARVVVLDGDVVQWVCGLGYMLEYEALNIPETARHPAKVTNHRMTSYLTFKVTLQPWARLAATTYYQPRLDEFGDFRSLLDVALEVDVLKHLALVLRFSLVHDSDPPDGIETTDTSFSPSIKVNW